MLRAEHLSQKLSSPIPTKDDGTLRTIKDACDYMAASARSVSSFRTGTATAVVCGDPQSVGGVAGSTDGRGIPVEHGAHLFGARQ